MKVAHDGWLKRATEQSRAKNASLVIELKDLPNFESGDGERHCTLTRSYKTAFSVMKAAASNDASNVMHVAVTKEPSVHQIFDCADEHLSKVCPNEENRRCAACKNGKHSV